MMDADYELELIDQEVIDQQREEDDEDRERHAE